MRTTLFGRRIPGFDSFRRLRLLAWSIGAAFLLAAIPRTSGARTPAPQTQPRPLDPYFASSPQLTNPMQPFENLPLGSKAWVRAAVVTMPDPLETPLARAFDGELAALITAFQTQHYVLDGFAFAWRPSAASTASTQPGAAPNRGRDDPSVLVFRRDDWREHPEAPKAAGRATHYYALFLVGATPTWGVHPKAFERAARCAIALHHREGTPVRLNDWHDHNCDLLPPPAGRAVLDVLGPAFSGSMESIAKALVSISPSGRAVASSKLHVDLLSPSATVDSNQRIQHDPLVQTDASLEIHYRTVAPTLHAQIGKLLSYIREKQRRTGTVVFLAEESSFGNGAVADATERNRMLSARQRPADDTSQSRKGIRLISVQFPPNIAAIRAEHASLDQKANQERRNLLPAHLLELDLTGVARRTDLPPVYQPRLTSRSDELLFYRRFDALKTYVHPIAVVIVATDIRDRLFLLREVRHALPNALPVILEQDNLLVHPDYRSVDRGTVVVPAGDTLVLLGSERDDSPIFPRDVSLRTYSEIPRQYFSFATDYAANTFRAAVVLLTGQPFHPDPPLLLVSTLAGFQSIYGTAAKPVNVLIAADARVQMQIPLYLAMAAIGMIFLVLAYRLFVDRSGGRVIQSLWETITWRGSRHHSEDGPTEPESMLKPQRVKLALLAACASGMLAIGLWRSLLISYCTQGHACFASEAFDLAHGRDPWAFAGLMLLLACGATTALLRAEVWHRRCNEYHRESPSGWLASQARGHSYSLALLLGGTFLVSTVAFVGSSRPMGVDSPMVSAFASLAVLAAGSFFLVLFWMQLGRWQRITRAFLKTVHTVNREGHIEGWPTPEMLDETPRSPFHLTVQDSDLFALRRYDSKKWIQTSTELMSGIWSGAASGFSQWQARLISEMKIASVAVRTSAWSAVLAPVVVLAMMQAYPPGSERIEIMLSVGLLTIGFGSLIYGALLIERDPLLSRMFTRNADRLSVRTAIGVVWPKLLGFGTLLAAAFLPDVWSWLHRIVQVLGVVGHWTA